MNFSCKDLSFMDEAISLLIYVYQEELNDSIDEDRSSELANDICYLENLLEAIRNEL